MSTETEEIEAGPGHDRLPRSPLTREECRALIDATNRVVDEHGYTKRLKDMWPVLPWMLPASVRPRESDDTDRIVRAIESLQRTVTQAHQDAQEAHAQNTLLTIYGIRMGAAALIVSMFVALLVAYQVAPTPLAMALAVAGTGMLAVIIRRRIRKAIHGTTPKRGEAPE